MITRRARAKAWIACVIVSAAILAGRGTAGAESPGILPDVAPMLRQGLFPGLPVMLDADTISYDEETGVAIAEGNVEVGFGSQTIRAERIRYDTRSGEAEFVGHVRYEQDGDEFSFERIVLNIKTELGVLYGGRIRISSNNFQIASEQMEKTGKRALRIRKGEITTCPCDPEPDWKFGIRRMTAELDGYAVGRNVTFRIRDVPVLWLPWAAFPIKLSRQSGFLIPDFSRSDSKGYSILLPYYWAINRWSDATFTLETMTRRGPRPEAEYRFVLNNASEGVIRGTLFRDQEEDDTRYRFYGENRFRFGEHWFSNATWDIVSDDQYYVDLVEEELLRTARHVPSRGFTAWKGSSDSHALGVDWVEDLQGTPDDNTVQRLPEYTGTVLPRTLGGTGITAGGDLQATYFYRRAGEREVRGRGGAGLSRSFTLFPSVVFTPYLSVDFLGGVPASDETGTNASGRFVPYGGGDLETVIRGRFPKAGNGRFVHIINPVAGFRYVPEVGQDDIPVYDMWDRVRPQQEILLSLYQRLLRFGKGGPTELAFLELTWGINAGERPISQSSYVDPLSPYVRNLRDQIDEAAGRPEQKDARSSDIFALFYIVPAERWKFSGEALIDPGTGSFVTASATGEWRKNDGNRAALGYRATQDLSEDVYGLLNVRAHRSLGVETSANYSLRNRDLTDGAVKFTIFPRSECWSVGIELKRETRPDQTSVRLTFGLGGIGTIGN